MFVTYVLPSQSKREHDTIVILHFGSRALHKYTVLNRCVDVDHLNGGGDDDDGGGRHNAKESFASNARYFVS